MSKSDDKPWVKKPDIIMEQFEEHIVFAADVANAEPLAAVPGQAHTQAEAPSEEAPAPSKLQDDTVYFVADGSKLTDSQLKFHTTETQVQTKVLLNETFDKGDSFSGDQFDNFTSRSAQATWSSADSGGQEGDTDAVIVSDITYPTKNIYDFNQTTYLMTDMAVDSSDYHVSVQFNANKEPSFGVYYCADAGASDKVNGFMFEITPHGSHTKFTH